MDFMDSIAKMLTHAIQLNWNIPKNLTVCRFVSSRRILHKIMTRRAIPSPCVKLCACPVQIQCVPKVCIAISDDALHYSYLPIHLIYLYLVASFQPVMSLSSHKQVHILKAHSSVKIPSRWTRRRLRNTGLRTWLVDYVIDMLGNKRKFFLPIDGYNYNLIDSSLFRA